MIEAKAYCHRCDTEFTVFVSEQDFKDGICYDECQCGKSGKFGLVEAPANIQQLLQLDSR